jgi:hypothetical protein
VLGGAIWAYLVLWTQRRPDIRFEVEREPEDKP